jgi:hypothetical protein
MLEWLKRWRQAPPENTLTPQQRRALWEEQRRKERVFIDTLEKKLADNFPTPDPEPREIGSLAGERFKTDGGLREPYFGEIERFPAPERDGFDHDIEQQPLLPVEPPPPEMPLVQYADRYQKLEADLRMAAAAPATNGKHSLAEPRLREVRPPAVDHSAALNTLLRAALFAADRHRNQRRKGVAREPYINHLLEVAALLADASDGEDTELVVAGLLHEAMEEQSGADEIAARFGTGVTALVAELADDRRRGMSETAPRPTRSEPLKSRRAQMIKIAELVSHVRALNVSPPTDWTAERRRDYILWAQRVVAGCRDASPRLEAVFDAACARGLEALKHLH